MAHLSIFNYSDFYMEHILILYRYQIAMHTGIKTKPFKYLKSLYFIQKNPDDTKVKLVERFTAGQQIIFMK